MFSLAPLRYRDVFADQGGPVTRVVADPFSVLGKPMTQASAYLRPELTVGKPEFALFGRADGCGTAPSKAVACHMAISEALERWAYLASRDGETARRYGFDQDDSSNGMSAFPGLFRWQAAGHARLEALERYAIVGWWAGCFEAEWTECVFPAVDALRIRHNAGWGEVVLLVKVTRAGAAYGQAGGRTRGQAMRRAAVELARAEFVNASQRAKGFLAEAANHLERRAVFFAGEAGYARVKERLARGADRAAPTWRVRFDGELPGPWSRWTTVWRCVVDMPSRAYLNADELFFFW